MYKGDAHEILRVNNSYFKYNMKNASHKDLFVGNLKNIKGNIRRLRQHTHNFSVDVFFWMRTLINMCF